MIGLFFLVMVNVVLFMLWRDGKKVNTGGQHADSATYDTAMSVLETQRNHHAARAAQYEEIADSLLSEMEKWKRKSTKTKIEYVQDLNAWRALPDDARDERVNFFTKELAKVDSIPVW